MSAPCRSSKARLPPLRSRPARNRACRPPALDKGAPARPLPLNPPPAASSSWPRVDDAHSPQNVFLKNAGTAPGRWPGPSFFIGRTPPQRGRRLFELDLRPHLFQRGLDLFRLFLGHAFLDRLRRGLDQVLRLLEAERGDGAHFLDHFDLLVADR